MLERIGNNDVIVTNYTSNFDVKEYIQEVLVPKAFPDIPMTKLNLGFTGVMSEYTAQAIEDAYSSGSLMMNEAFITKAVLPNSIYAEGSLFNLGYTYAVPSTCDFALEISIADIIKHAELVQNTTTYRYILDKNTQLILGDNIYRLDYDIFIEYTMINRKRVFNIYYNMEEINSISGITSKYVKYQTSSDVWLILFLNLKEFDRKVDTASITDNLLTTNSDIEITWTRQIAGLDLVYISPTGQRIPMKLKTKYTKPNPNAFAWYTFKDDYTISLSFSNNVGYWSPDFNSKVEYTIYTTRGKNGNFDSYDRNSGVPVKKSADRFSYNADTMMVALCYSGSVGGLDKGDVETLRDEIILAYNSANVLTTDNDLQLWFEVNAKRNGTKSKFFKRRDDPSGRLFAQFIAIVNDTYVYPTNTLSIQFSPDQCDIVDGQDEFVISPGHLWEYTNDRHTVKMVTSSNGKPIKVTDPPLPEITGERPFIFINPFYIKIHRNPDTMMMYNYLLNDTSWPEDEEISSSSIYRFQLAQFNISRSITTTESNKYHIEVTCVPVITTNDEVEFCKEIDNNYYTSNTLRLVFITRSHGQDTGFIEMKPIKKLEGGSFLFATDLYIEDNIRNDMTIKILKEETGIHSLGFNDADIFIDASQTAFDFITIIKDGSAGSILFNNIDGTDFTGYTITNRFRNRYRELDLYTAMSMMRTNLTFDYNGSGDSVNINQITASLIPLMRYDIITDTEKMMYFIRAFAEQYRAMQPVLSQLNGNDFIDMKLYNSYGKSNNYYIGPMEQGGELKASTQLLDDVYVKVKLTMSVYDRSIYSQTALEVKSRIISLFDNLKSSNTDIHASNIIHDIVENVPNVKYVRFDGFNNEPVYKSSIFIKESDENALSEDQLATRVPEIISVDEDSITITEET